MTETRLCPECGALLPANGPRGLCTQCALDRALAMTHGNSLVQSVEAPAPAAGPQPLPWMAVNIPLGTFGEYELLEIFVTHANRALSRDWLMDQLRGFERDPFDRSIDVRVNRLRKKLEEDPANPAYIRTQRGQGYLFIPQGKGVA